MSEDLFRVQELQTKRFTLKKKHKHAWVDNAFISPDIEDELAINYANTDGFLGRILSKRRITFLFTVLITGFTLVLSRAAHLQIAQGATYRSQADGNRIRSEDIRADRGLVYDRFQQPLVQNIPNFVVTIIPRSLPLDQEKRKTLLQELYQDYLLQYSDLTLDEFIAYVEASRLDRTKSDKQLILAQSLKQDHATRLQIESYRFPGLEVNQFARRKYLTEGPIGIDATDTTVYAPVQSLSHLLGYLTSLREGEYEEKSEEGYLYNDVIGRTGLEAYYEKELRGSYGKVQKEVDVFGNFNQVLHQEAPADGLSLQTSLDLEMQRTLELSLQTRMEEAEKARGSAIVMNPNTGEILSMVSLPTFDNNDFARGVTQAEYSSLIENKDQPLFHRAITGEYPSGSIFKPIVASAALHEGIVEPSNSFMSTGGIRINRWFFPDWRAGGHGLTNVYHALADSVNTYFYIIGGGYNDFTGLGVARISDYAKEFGLASQLTIDLPGESEGFLPSKEWKESVKNERWYVGDTYHLAIGQGDLLVTPLQMATMTATFANGGTVYRPHIVTDFIDKDLQPSSSFSPVILNEDFIDAASMDAVRQGLRRVVTQGSGRRLGDLPIEVAGKTGTAQWHSERDPHSWFMGFAPYDNPEIAFVVMVEEGGEGSGVSLSVAKDLLQWWSQNRSLPQ